MTAPILYLGDTSLDTAAAYLAGVMAHARWEFDYVPSDRKLTRDDVGSGRHLFILSDYPSARIGGDLQNEIAAAVSGGAGLLMIGGWESYHGLGGDWDGTPLGDILPVEIDTRDDRRNCDHPVFVQPVGDHEIVAGLPWRERPPLIGGYNQIRSRASGATVLQSRSYAAAFEGDALRLAPRDIQPLLVVGRHGEGRTAALATDVAPHWVGPLVDWGPERVTARGPGAGEVEVGNLYVELLERLIGWTGRLQRG